MNNPTANKLLCSLAILNFNCNTEVIFSCWDALVSQQAKHSQLSFLYGSYL